MKDVSATRGVAWCGECENATPYRLTAGWSAEERAVEFNTYKVHHSTRCPGGNSALHVVRG